MKILVTAMLIATLEVSLAAPPTIGKIVEATDSRPPKIVGVTYAYTKKRELILTFAGISMNAAAKSVTGKVTVNGSSIEINAHEIYDENGPFDSLKTYTIRYTIKNIPKGAYLIKHDDLHAEGVDRLVTVDIDVRKSTKGQIEVIPQEYYRVDLTPDNPWDNKEELRLTPLKKQAEQVGADQPATAPESKSEGNEKPKLESEGRSQ